jgi:hypothetical protein
MMSRFTKKSDLASSNRYSLSQHKLPNVPKLDVYKRQAVTISSNPPFSQLRLSTKRDQNETLMLKSRANAVEN